MDYEFPKFKPLDWDSRHLLQEISHKFDAYSDFNFNSLYSWDIHNTNKFSILNGNLIIMISDYLSGERIFSMLGNKSVTHSLAILLDYIVESGYGDTLKLIPRVVVDSIEDFDEFTISEDFDNHDYLFSIRNLSELSGNRFKNKRQAALNCEKDGRVTIEFFQTAEILKDSIVELLESWEHVKLGQEKNADMQLEREAISRILNIFDKQNNLLLSTAKLEGKLIGFSIDEFLPRNYVLSHYFKTLPKVRGISEYLNRQVARELLRHGAEVWNWEQDLGIESLRRMKLGYRPIIKQKKYQVSKRKF